MARASPVPDSAPLAGHPALDGSQPTLWHGSAPPVVRRLSRAGRLADAWDAWVRHLATRKRPAALTALVPGGAKALFWAVQPGAAGSRLSELVRLVDWLPPGRQQRAAGPQAADLLQGHLLAWLSDAAGAAPSLRYALEALAWGHLLPAAAARVESEAWWALLNHLVATASDAAPALDEHPLLHQLLAAELPLTLAYLLPEINLCRRLARAGRRAFSTGLIELLDGRGMLHGKHLALLRPLLACWTRCVALKHGLKGGGRTAAAGKQYRWLVRNTLRLARPDGSAVFGDRPACHSDVDWLRTAVQLGGDATDRRIAAAVLPPGRKTPLRRPPRKSSRPKSAVHSPWAGVAVLRPGWSRRGPCLSVSYPGQTVQLELRCGGDVLCSGCWEMDICCDGRPVLPTSDWEELCWISDADADYLELEIDLDGGMRVQRHLLMARQDRFLLLADAILGEQPAAIEYRGSLPLEPGVDFRPAPQAREGYLWGRKRRALVLPLALPEWRSEVRVGELSRIGRRLQLHQACEGRRLFAPLWLDLDRDRMRCRRTWRALTVAESLSAVAAEVAVAYRVAVGKQQWLIYRSLGRKDNRTLLGHNLSTEMLVARFRRSGEVQSLVELE